jgi:hypothetical protein
LSDNDTREEGHAAGEAKRRRRLTVERHEEENLAVIDRRRPCAGMEHLMEPSGRNRRATRRKRLTAETAQPGRAAAGSNHGNGSRAHGKEEVDRLTKTHALGPPNPC